MLEDEAVLDVGGVLGEFGKIILAGREDCLDGGLGRGVGDACDRLEGVGGFVVCLKNTEHREREKKIRGNVVNVD
jgi:hypothetical protein